MLIIICCNWCKQCTLISTFQPEIVHYHIEYVTHLPVDSRLTILSTFKHGHSFHIFIVWYSWPGEDNSLPPVINTRSHTDVPVAVSHELLHDIGAPLWHWRSFMTLALYRDIGTLSRHWYCVVTLVLCHSIGTLSWHWYCVVNVSDFL